MGHVAWYKEVWQGGRHGRGGRRGRGREAWQGKAEMTTKMY